MPFTNTKESGFESLIVRDLVNRNGYEQGANADYDKEFALDVARLLRFLQATQPVAMETLGVMKSETKRRQFFSRLSREISRRGIIDVLRKGVKVYPADLILFYMTPTENNARARALFAQNIFSVTDRKSTRLNSSHP